VSRADWFYQRFLAGTADFVHAHDSPFCHRRADWRFLTKGDRQMESKPAQNIQDSFLNTARKDKTSITLYLLSGVKLTGRIRSFDKYSLVLETGNQEQLIFKHAISTVVMPKTVHVERPMAAGEAKPAQHAADVATAGTSSGTEG
jgi:host factor-I protein